MRGAAPSHLGGYVHVSERTLNELLHRDVSYRETVHESALGMSTRGTAQADCHISFDLRPNGDFAQMRLTMTGKAAMDDTVSSRRRIRVYSSSETSIAAHKDVFFNLDGLRLAHSVARCRSAIAIHGIAAPGPLIERIAWRQALAMQPDAERATERSASRRTEERLEAEAGRPLADLNREYAENIREPLLERQLMPTVRFSTDSRHAFAQVFLRRPPSAANRSRPAPRPARDVAVCFREELVNEICADILSGKTLADHHFADLMQTILGATPRPLWVHRRSEPWEVEFAREAPLTATFQRDLATITLRMVRVGRGDARWNGEWEIAADYALEITPDGPHLIRQGPLRVVERSPADGIDSDDEIRGFLASKFGAVLPEELYFDGLVPPEGGSWGRIRRLSLKQFTARDGWLAIGYELDPSPAATKQLASQVERR